MMKNMFSFLWSLMKMILIIILLLMLFLEQNILKWMLLEMFTLIFIGFFMNYNEENKKGSMLYFYISTFIGLLIFWALLVYFGYMSWKFYSIIDYNKIVTKKIIMFLFLMKLGMFPYQFWMPMLFPMLSWDTIYLFSTINKMTPILFLTTLSAFKDPVFMYFLMLNSIVSVIIPINEQNFKKIMAYSSINHSTFIVLLSYLNTSLSTVYFIIYMLNSFIFMKIMKQMNLNMKSDLMSSYNSKFMNFMFTIFTITYSMLPPFMFFIIKWFFFYETTMSNSTNFFLIIIMLSSVMMIYNYLDMNKFSIFHMKLTKKQIMLKKFYTQNKSMCKILLFLLNVFIFSMLFY